MGGFGFAAGGDFQEIRSYPANGVTMPEMSQAVYDRMVAQIEAASRNVFGVPREPSVFLANPEQMRQLGESMLRPFPFGREVDYERDVEDGMTVEEIAAYWKEKRGKRD